jgi:hypothetical protein
MSAYVKPTIVSSMRASKAIAQNVNGSNPATKIGGLQDFRDSALCHSTSGAYQADE